MLSTTEGHRAGPRQPIHQDQGHHATRLRVGALTIGLALLALSLAACGDDDADASTMPLAEWVAAFDEVCLQVITDVEADPEDFEAISDRGIAEMQALPEPDEMADTAADLLDMIGSDQDPDLSQAEIDAIEDLLLEDFTALGVSHACVGGLPD